MKTQVLNPGNLTRHLLIVALVLTLFSCSKKEQVTPPIVPPAETPEVSVDFLMGIDGTRAPASVTFYNNSHNVTWYRWDFGDGTGSDQKSPVKVYENGGTYSIRLTAINDAGISKTLIKTLTIGAKSTSLTIKKVTVTNMLLSGYDISDKSDPDVFFTIYPSGNPQASITESETAAELGLLPKSWTLNTVADFGDAPGLEYTVQFWDKDDNEKNESMGSVRFKPEDYITRKNYYPPVISLTNGTTSVSLEVEWN